MDIALNFTLGLTEGISWPWPIAVYLFLAGISGGAGATPRKIKHKSQNTPPQNPPIKR